MWVLLMLRLSSGASYLCQPYEARRRYDSVLLRHSELTYSTPAMRHSFCITTQCHIRPELSYCRSIPKPPLNSASSLCTVRLCCSCQTGTLMTAALSQPLSRDKALRQRNKFLSAGKHISGNSLPEKPTLLEHVTGRQTQLNIGFNHL